MQGLHDDLKRQLLIAQSMLRNPQTPLAYRTCVDALRDAYRMAQILTAHTGRPWPLLIAPHVLHQPNFDQHAASAAWHVDDALLLLADARTARDQDSLYQHLAASILEALKLL